MKKSSPQAGFKPGSATWQASDLTARLSRSNKLEHFNLCDIESDIAHRVDGGILLSLPFTKLSGKQNGGFQYGRIKMAS